MRLQVAKALVGEPAAGDMLHVTLEDDTSFSLIYRPHELWNDYIWCFDDAHLKLREVQVELQKLADRGIELDYVTPYVDHHYSIVIGSPLHLTLAPNGNLNSWPRLQTSSAIEFIVVR
jgi:hypothetical protein